MKIALTGATGFVGRTLVRCLEDAGHDVVRMVRHNTGKSSDIVTGPLEESDPDFLSASLSGIDAIAHLAALTHVAANAKDAREAFWRVNVEGTRRLLVAATSAKEIGRAHV